MDPELIQLIRCTPQSDSRDQTISRAKKRLNGADPHIDAAVERNDTVSCVALGRQLLHINRTLEREREK